MPSIQLDGELIIALADVGKFLIEDGVYQKYSGKNGFVCIICEATLSGSNPSHQYDCPIPQAIEAWHKSHQYRFQTGE